jgi:glycolate oxidase iron-sulfur subunit
MDSWQRNVHEASQIALEAAGLGVTPTGAAVPCCGALHTHAGLPGGAERAIADLLRELDPSRPIVVDAAGCGAAMKGYGAYSTSPDPARLSARVVDVGEILATRLDHLPSAHGSTSASRSRTRATSATSNGCIRPRAPCSRTS